MCYLSICPCCLGQQVKEIRTAQPLSLNKHKYKLSRNQLFGSVKREKPLQFQTPKSHVRAYFVYSLIDTHCSCAVGRVGSRGDRICVSCGFKVVSVRVLVLVTYMNPHQHHIFFSTLVVVRCVQRTYNKSRTTYGIFSKSKAHVILNTILWFTKHPRAHTLWHL